MATTEAIHHRQASGLVREGKPTDGALFNVLGTTLGPVIGWILLLRAVRSIPGSNVLLATTIAFACCIGLNVVYALFAATHAALRRRLRLHQPHLLAARRLRRKRQLHVLAGLLHRHRRLVHRPALARDDLPRAWPTGPATTTCRRWGNWFNTHWGRMISGLVLLAILVYPVLLTSRRGLRRYFRFQRWVFYFCGVTLLATAVALAVMSHGAFVSAWNHYVRAFSPHIAHPVLASSSRPAGRMAPSAFTSRCSPRPGRTTSPPSC